MAIGWLTEVERDRLQRFPSSVSELDLITTFTLTDADRQLVLSRHGAGNRLGIALQLCALRYLGFIPEAMAAPPMEVVRFVAGQLGLPVEAVDQYRPRREQTRTEHAKTVADHLGFRRYGEAERQSLKQWLRDRALEHDQPLTLLRLVCERLLADKVIRPGETELVRQVSAARREAELHLWKQIQLILTPDRIQSLDALLTVTADLRQTGLNWLRTGACSATATEILAVLRKITFVRSFGLTDQELAALNPNRVRTLARIAQTSTNQMLQRMPVRRRYPILLAFVRESLITCTDEALDLFNRNLHDANARAVRELDELRQSLAQATNEKVRLLRTLGRIVLDPQVTDADLRQTVYRAVPPEILKLAVEDCDRIERPADGSHFDLLANRYSHLRQFTPQLLDTFTWRGQAEFEGLLKGLAAVRAAWVEGRRTLPGNAPAAFIPDVWMPYVFPESGGLRHRYYELCVLWELRTALRSGNVWVDGGRRYADPTGFLIPPQRWTEVRADACRMMNAPLAAAQRLDTRITEMKAAAQKVEALLSETSPIRLDADHRLVLTPLDAETRPPSVEPLEQMIAERLPRVNLAELLIETDRWVNFTSTLTHLTHHHRCKISDLPTLYGALLSQSGNFGAARMAQMSDLPEHLIAWATTWHLREATLTQAINLLINYHHRLPLTQRWGGGTVSSSDGQRLRVAVKSLTATALPRDFGFGQGLTVYTWTSDQHTQYGTKVIPASLREATVVLDGILGNESDLSIEEHSTDTGG